MTAPSTASRAQTSWLRIQTFSFFAGWCIVLTYWGLWLTAARHIAPETVGIALAIGLAARGIAALVIAPAACSRFGDANAYRILGCIAAFAATLYLLPLSHPLLFTVSAFVGLTYSPLMAILETTLIHAHDAAAIDYGRTRAFGSAAFISATVITGLVTTLTGAGSIIYIFLTLLAVSMICSLARYPTTKSPRCGTTPDTSMRSIIRTLRTTPGYPIVLGSCVAIQATHGAYYGYASVRLSAAHLPDIGISLCLLTAVTAEIIGFRLSDRIIAKRNLTSLLSICATGACLRWGVLAASTHPAVFLATQPLHAVSFALTHATYAHYLRRHMHVEAISTAQCLYTAIGLSWATGTLTALSGALYRNDGRWSFTAMAALAALTAIITTTHRTSRPPQ